jgi:hypothetical protein
MITQDPYPPPASPEARQQGCTCPDQAPMRGPKGVPWYRMNPKCWMHGTGEEEDE